MKKKSKVITNTCNITAEEIRLLFKKDGFSEIERKWIPYKHDTKSVGKEILKKNPAMVTEFNKMKSRAGNLVRPSDYVLITIQKFLKHVENEQYNIDEVVVAYLFTRLKNASIGFMAEFYCIIMMIENFDNIIILTNEKWDLEEGVDFILIEFLKMRAFPVHVTALSAGKDSLDQKEKRASKRNDSFDVPLFYNKIENDVHSFRIGEFAFFTKSYLRSAFNNWRNNKNTWHPGENVGYKLDDPKFIERFGHYEGNIEMFKARKIENRYEPLIEKAVLLFQK